MLTTPAQQAAAAEAARKESAAPEKVETPVPAPMAGSKTILQPQNLNENKVVKIS